MNAARDLLVRGLLAGLLAGVAAFVVAYAVGEPSVSAAVALEESQGAAGHDHPGTAGDDHGAAAAEPGQEHATVVPRALQSTLGLATATIVAGTTLGGLVGVVSALAMGRFGRLSTRGVPLLVTGLGFVATSLVPFLAYPPNPPAVGQAGTVGYRSELYVLLVAVSLIVGVTAVLLARRLAGRWGAWYATLACSAGYALVVGIAVALMPGYDEVPAGFPAGLLYDFRRASLLVQVTLWGVVGVATAELAHRLAVRHHAGARPKRLVDA